MFKGVIISNFQNAKKSIYIFLDVALYLVQSNEKILFDVQNLIIANRTDIIKMKEKRENTISVV